MMEDLGDFFFKISRQKKQNFDLISDYCLNKSTQLLDKLNTKLNDFIFAFNDIKDKYGHGSKGLGLDSRGMSHISDKEEEKVPGDLMFINLTHQVSTGSKSKAQNIIKLESQDEKLLRQNLKVYEDSEVLYRIFKLFNLFYDKFSAEEEKQKEEMQINTD